MKQTVSAESILPVWRRIYQDELEHGRVPIFSLGRGQMEPTRVPGLTALDRLTRQPAGIAELVVLVGGESALWLSALHQVGPRQPLMPNLPETGITGVLYTGPDPATHAAAVNLLSQMAQSTGAPSISTQTPVGLRWTLGPDQQVAAAGPWEWLPFEVKDAPNTLASNMGQASFRRANMDETGATSTSTKETHVSWQATETWLAYTSLFLVLLMLIRSLL